MSLEYDEYDRFNLHMNQTSVRIKMSSFDKFVEIEMRV